MSAMQHDHSSLPSRVDARLWYDDGMPDRQKNVLLWCKPTELGDTALPAEVMRAATPETASAGRPASTELRPPPPPGHIPVAWGLPGRALWVGWLLRDGETARRSSQDIWVVPTTGLAFKFCAYLYGKQRRMRLGFLAKPQNGIFVFHAIPFDSPLMWNVFYFPEFAPTNRHTMSDNMKQLECRRLVKLALSELRENAEEE